MMNQLEPAFVLHTRAFRETSIIAELFTLKHGKISVVARGAKRPKSPLRAILQPFTLLLVSITGKNELMVLCQAEISKIYTIQSKMQIWSGYYINELLIRLLAKSDPHPELFQFYQQTLASLAAEQNNEIILRSFEAKLLRDLGYGMSLDKIANTHDKINIEHEYYYYFDKGVMPCAEEILREKACKFSGKNLLAISENRFENAEILRDAKYLFRYVINHLLNDKKIYSRELFK